ncbi:hypothetical protein AB0F15_18055 [Amycolatopsis sp. NPDC026612]
MVVGQAVNPALPWRTRVIIAPAAGCTRQTARAVPDLKTPLGGPV